MTLLMHAADEILQRFNERNINFKVSFLLRLRQRRRGGVGGGRTVEMSPARVCSLPKLIYREIRSDGF